MKEIWKDIEGYEGLYQVSNFGDVKSLIYHNGTKNRILTPTVNNRGYAHVVLHNNGKVKTFTVHRLVGDAFLKKQDLSFDQINHKDGVKTNNNVTNLEWCNSMINNRHRAKVLGRVGGLPSCIKVRCVENGEIYYSIRDAERKYGRTGLAKVVKKVKGHNTYAGLHWELI